MAGRCADHMPCIYWLGNRPSFLYMYVRSLVGWLASEFVELSYHKNNGTLIIYLTYNMTYGTRRLNAVFTETSESRSLSESIQFFVLRPFFFSRSIPNIVFSCLDLPRVLFPVGLPVKNLKAPKESGGPKTRWVDCILWDLKRLGVDNWKRMALERND